MIEFKGTKLKDVYEMSFDSEEDAAEYLAWLKDNHSGEITKSSVERKLKKKQGFVIAEKFVLRIQIDYEKVFDYLEFEDSEEE